MQWWWWHWEDTDTLKVWQKWNKRWNKVGNELDSCKLEGVPEPILRGCLGSSSDEDCTIGKETVSCKSPAKVVRALWDQWHWPESPIFPNLHLTSATSALCRRILLSLRSNYIRNFGKPPTEDKYSYPRWAVRDLMVFSRKVVPSPDHRYLWLWHPVDTGSLLM